MRFAIVLTLIAALATSACNAPEAEPVATNAPQPELTEIPKVGHLALAQPIDHGRISFIPVVAKDTGREDLFGDYLTLTEARRLNLVEITELDEGEVVEVLLVRNESDRPLLLLGGELLLGGKQDRIVARDVVVPPNTEMKVSVYCVEQGRWSGEDRKFEPKQMVVPDRVRKAATYKGQSQVWSGVADYNAAAGAASHPRSTIDVGLDSPKVRAELEANVQKIVAELDRRENVVGFIVAIDGKPDTMELFGSAKLFKAMREPLLSSFLAEAAVRDKGRAARVDLEGAARFVTESLSSRRRIIQDDEKAGAQRALAGHNAAVQGMELLPPSTQRREKDAILHGTYQKK